MAINNMIVLTIPYLFFCVSVQFGVTGVIRKCCLAFIEYPFSILLLYCFR